MTIAYNIYNFEILFLSKDDIDLTEWADMGFDGSSAYDYVCIPYKYESGKEIVLVADEYLGEDGDIDEFLPGEGIVDPNSIRIATDDAEINSADFVARVKLA